MKLLHSFTTSVVVFSLATFLTGCAGVQSTPFPDTPSQTSLGTIQGSVFGGHAPIVGAHVFVLEAPSLGTAYAAASTSLMSSSSVPKNASYPVAQDTSGGPTNGLYFVTTDGNGAFNVSGDYACDTGQPVYLYASGGSVGTGAAAITGINFLPVIGGYAYTFTVANNFSPNESVVLTGITGQYAFLNNTTQTVLLPSGLGFVIFSPTAPNLSAGATQTGAVSAVNPAAVNMAMLGVCGQNLSSTTGNFSGLPFVFMNEVSTAALAYGMAGFGTDGLHISSSSTNLTGLQSATKNTANLYDITGANVGSGSNGEGHIARAVTAAGNGTVPQAEMDTLGNILANCIDSPQTTVAASTACTTLFAAATSNGLTSGTKPADIATAIFNIAHNPASANVVALATSYPKTAPFQPSLPAAPLDFTVAITYNNIATPSGVAIDSNGNVFIPTNATSGGVTKLSPTGVVLKTSAVTGPNFNAIAIDPFNYVWAISPGTSSNSGLIYEYDDSLSALLYSPFGSGQLNFPSGIAIDSVGQLYVTDGGNNSSTTQTVQQFKRSGGLNASINNGCFQRTSTVAIDPSLYVWTTASGNTSCRVSSANSSAAFSISPSGPTNFAIDSGGNGWVAAAQQTNLFKVTPSGGSTGYGVINNVVVGGLSIPTFVAIDGANNVWITNNGNAYGLSEFSSTGAAITGSAGYQGTVLNKPATLAIDQSGNVWVPNSGNSTVTELVGAGVPTVQPLAMLTYGVKP